MKESERSLGIIDYMRWFSYIWEQMGNEKVIKSYKEQRVFEMILFYISETKWAWKTYKDLKEQRVHAILLF